jgi:hypothetical protein
LPPKINETARIVQATQAVAQNSEHKNTFKMRFNSPRSR